MAPSNVSTCWSVGLWGWLTPCFFNFSSKTSLDESEVRSEMLCMLAVPTSLTTHDLLQFTAPCNPDIQHMRIIRDSTPNQYMVLIKFRSQVHYYKGSLVILFHPN